MLKNGGLLTEFFPGTNPDRENFHMRNRIVAGLCDATIVIESGKKGGSLITAELAFDYNREVFAYPGDVTRMQSSGCHDLIKTNKAHLMTTADDLFATLNWKNEEKRKKNTHLFTPVDELEKKIFLIIEEFKEIHYDTLWIKLNLPHPKLNSYLLNLELNGIIQSCPGKKYKIHI